MPMLTYCITEASAHAAVPASGVGGAHIQVFHHSGLQCLTSSLEAEQMAKLSGRDAALEFHRVLQEVFESSAIIPFRFPTTVQDEAELFRFLHERASEYHESLNRLRDMVQMEIRIARETKQHDAPVPRHTGTAYLRAKQQREARLRAIAERIRAASNTTVSEWRERDSSEAKRIFALVPRSSLALFKDQLANLKVEQDYLIRISGPWPPAEFLNRST